MTAILIYRHPELQVIGSVEQHPEDAPAVWTRYDMRGRWCDCPGARRIVEDQTPPDPGAAYTYVAVCPCRWGGVPAAVQ